MVGVRKLELSTHATDLLAYRVHETTDKLVVFFVHTKKQAERRCNTD